MLKFFLKTILIIVFSSYALISTAQKPTLTVLGMKNYPPFTFEKDGEMVGIDNEVMYEIEKRMNVEINMIYVPWKRLLKTLEWGTADAGFALFYTDERAKYALYADIEPIHGGSFYLYVRKGDEFKFKNIPDLYNKKIGLQASFSVSEEFDQAVKAKKIGIQKALSNANNIDMLLAHRMDVFIGHEIVTSYNALEMGVLDKITKLPLPISEKNAYLVLSKSSKTFKNKSELLDKINQALISMKADGSHQKIVNKYTQ